MTYTQIEWNDLHTTVRVNAFNPADGVAEFHAMIEINAVFSNAEEQYLMLEETVQRLSKCPELKGATLV